MTRKEFLIFISSFDLTCKKLHKIFEFFDQETFSFDIVNYKEFIDLVGKENIKKIQDNANEDYLERYKDELFNKNTKLITFEDKDYPKKLKNLADAPYFLFCKGDLSLLNKKGIAIVGTRIPTNYGKIVTEKFAKELAENEVVIISGLAYGVDSISHRKALESNGKTIAVLGGGFDKIYPSQHTDLAREIAEKGLLISEYSPSFHVAKFTFPSRNRIVAGLSDGVLITEAGNKSGTMITKDFALDNGINIYAIPGNITSEKSAGTNNIIMHGQGECVLSPQDILKDLGIDKIEKKKILQLNFEEQIIVDLLREGEKDVDYLCEKSGLNVNKLNSLLVSLEIRDIIKKMVGGVYAISE